MTYLLLHNVGAKLLWKWPDGLSLLLIHTVLSKDWVYCMIPSRTIDGTKDSRLFMHVLLNYSSTPS